MMPIVRDGGGLAFKPRPREVPDSEHEAGRPAAVWLDVFTSGIGFDWLCKHLGLVFPCPPDHHDVAPLMVINSLGISFARIVVEKPAQGELARWREAMSDEDGVAAAVLPVGRAGRHHGTESCLLLSGSRDDCPTSGPGAVADLIALPLAGGGAVSFTGLTAAIGGFAPDDSGKLVLAASGLRFLKRHIARAYAMELDWPAHLVSRKLPFPDHFETLLIDPGAFEWRMTESGCVVSEAVKRIASPDSVQLARFVDEAMKKRDRVRKPPPVLAPKGGAG